MRKILRNNSLSLVMFSLFGLCLLGHSLAGYAAYHDDQQAHGQPPIRALHKNPKFSTVFCAGRDSAQKIEVSIVSVSSPC